MRRIDSDQRHFQDILKGKVRDNLRKYISNTDDFGKVGKDIVKIPIPRINIPHFTYGKERGIGQGDGEAGDEISPGKDDDSSAGDKEGKHFMEAELTVDDLAKMLGEELELPNIKPRGNKTIDGEKNIVRGIRRDGINNMRDFKRGYKNALRRTISSGSYEPGKPVIPIRDDMRYRTLRPEPKPYYSAVIIYMMDISGSMGEQQKRIVRTTSFWLSAWLNLQYKGVEERFIVHDMVAKEVERKEFFQTAESGGTKISSAYELCLETILKNYNSQEYNIYPFHFSDGDNWKDDDNKASYLVNELLKHSNVFCYGQCKGLGGTDGHFIDLLAKNFGLKDKRKREESTLRIANLHDGSNIPEALKQFLKTGR